MVGFLVLCQKDLGSRSDFMCTTAQLISVDLLQIYVAVGEGLVLMFVIGTNLRNSIHCKYSSRKLIQ